MKRAFQSSNNSKFLFVDSMENGTREYFCTIWGVNSHSSELAICFWFLVFDTAEEPSSQKRCSFVLEKSRCNVVREHVSNFFLKLDLHGMPGPKESDFLTAFAHEMASWVTGQSQRISLQYWWHFYGDEVQPNIFELWMRYSVTLCQEKRDIPGCEKRKRFWSEEGTDPNETGKVNSVKKWTLF